MNTDDKLNKILETMTEMRITMASMESDLRHHIKRSDAHELKLAEQGKVINKLWYAIFALAGTGLGASGPSIAKWLGSLI